MADISLIIPTYGRYEEVNQLLVSLSKQLYPLEKIEIIIVDQNDSIDLTPVILKHQPALHIIHEKTMVKGIANAKNKGIALASAPVISFPDDDCLYYENTVSAAIDFFKNNPDVDMVYGRVYDREKKINIMRNWPLKNIKLNLYNFHLNYSAITCFTTKKSFLFDTRFGVGAKYSSGEELDYVISAIEKKWNVVYTYTIDVWHPQLNLSVMPLQKIYNYAEGYGVICKKHFGFPVFYLFFKSVTYQLILAIMYSCLFKKEKAVKHFTALKGRIKGFYEFKEQ